MYMDFPWNYFLLVYQVVRVCGTCTCTPSSVLFLDRSGASGAAFLVAIATNTRVELTSGRSQLPSTIFAPPQPLPLPHAGPLHAGALPPHTDPCTRFCSEGWHASCGVERLACDVHGCHLRLANAVSGATNLATVPTHQKLDQVGLSQKGKFCHASENEINLFFTQKMPIYM